MQPQGLATPQRLIQHQPPALAARLAGQQRDRTERIAGSQGAQPRGGLRPKCAFDAAKAPPSPTASSTRTWGHIHRGNLNALGTIGGGNHFAELQTVEERVDERAAAELLGPDERVLLLERISQPPKQDRDASEVDEAEVVLGLLLVTGDEAPEAHQPGEEALDVPAPSVASKG